MSEAPNAWLVRGAKNGTRDQWMLSSGLTGVDFSEVPSLADVDSLPAMRNVVRTHIHGLTTEGAVNNYAAQLFAFAQRIEPGDSVILPLKNSAHIALGIVEGDYEYQPGDKPLNHLRRVRWVRTDVPRSAIRQDMLYSLGAFSTVVRISRNDAAQRFLALIGGAEEDPGARADRSLLPQQQEDEVQDSDEAVLASGMDILRYSQDRIQGRLSERFAGHRLTEIVAAILTAEGMRCIVSPPGSDGGVDILAGSGPLGVAPPRIAVQVKSQPNAVGSPVLDQLGGVVEQHRADHGLLVAIGGVTRQAQEKLNQQPFRFAVWDADELIQRIYRHYLELPEDIRDDLPLRQAWIIDESPSN